MKTNPNRGARIAAFVAAAALAVFSLGLLAAGGAFLWADGQKDADGYIASDTDRFATTTRALTTENVDLDLDGLDAVVGRDSYGKLRLEVASNGDAPVFVGVAPTDDVSSYLRGTDHAVVTDLDGSPSRGDLRERPGAAVPAPPAEQRFWEAASHGKGTQTLTWDVEGGDWSVVVMNADGSSGVDAGVSAGVSAGFLDETGWVLLGTGLLVAAGAVAFLYAGGRPPRARRDPVAPRVVASS